MAMKENGEGEETSSEGYQDGPSSTPKFDSLILSSSVLDDRDSKILSHTRSRPATLLSVSEKADMSFVECLKRAKRLQRMGFLKRLDDPSCPDGLYLYIANGHHTWNGLEGNEHID